MRNPYMKFQNCILINFVTDEKTDKPEAICPFNFSKVGGIKKLKSADNNHDKYPSMQCVKTQLNNFSSEWWNGWD